MARSTTFSVPKLSQPDESAWQAALDFAERWNAAAPANPLQLLYEMFLQTDEVPAEHPENAALQQAFDELAASHGVVILAVVNETLDAAALAAADFISILGAGLDGPHGRRFARGGDLGPELPCPLCGSAGPWSAPQCALFTIDESRLHGSGSSLNQGEPPGPEGWDVVNLPNGHLAVSQRFMQVLRDLGARGWTERALVSKATGEPSTRMVQLAATTFLPTPCPRHASSEATSVCPSCGVVLEGRLELGWYLPRAAVEGIDLFSRDRNLGNALYLGRALFDELSARGMSGMAPLETARLCDHPLRTA